MTPSASCVMLRAGCDRWIASPSSAATAWWMALKPPTGRASRRSVEVFAS